MTFGWRKRKDTGKAFKLRGSAPLSGLTDNTPSKIKPSRISSFLKKPTRMALVKFDERRRTNQIKKIEEMASFKQQRYEERKLHDEKEIQRLVDIQNIRRRSSDQIKIENIKSKGALPFDGRKQVIVVEEQKQNSAVQIQKGALPKQSTTSVGNLASTISVLTTQAQIEQSKSVELMNINNELNRQILSEDIALIDTNSQQAIVSESINAMEKNLKIVSHKPKKTKLDKQIREQMEKQVKELKRLMRDRDKLNREQLALKDKELKEETRDNRKKQQQMMSELNEIGNISNEIAQKQSQEGGLSLRQKRQLKIAEAKRDELLNKRGDVLL